MLEEAKKRDHRKLGKELELFHFSHFAGNPAYSSFPSGHATMAAVVFGVLAVFLDRLCERRYRFQQLKTDAHLEKKQSPLPFPAQRASNLAHIRHGLEEILGILSARH